MHCEIKLSTTEDTEDAEEIIGLLCVLRVLCGGEFDFVMHSQNRTPNVIGKYCALVEVFANVTPAGTLIVGPHT